MGTTPTFFQGKLEVTFTRFHELRVHIATQAVAQIIVHKM